MTNADRIRTMTEEELANVLAYGCVYAMWDGLNCEGRNCCDCMLDWLKQEVSDNA